MVTRPKSANYNTYKKPSSNIPHLIIQDVSYQHQQFFPPKSWTTRPTSASSTPTNSYLKQRGNKNNNKSNAKGSEDDKGLPQLIIGNSINNSNNNNIYANSNHINFNIDQQYYMNSNNKNIFYEGNFVYNSLPSYESSPYTGNISSEVSYNSISVPPFTAPPNNSKSIRPTSPRSTSPHTYNYSSHNSPNSNQNNNNNLGIWVGLNHNDINSQNSPPHSPSSPTSPSSSYTNRDNNLHYNISTLAAALNTEQSKQFQLKFNEKINRPLSREIRRKNEREMERERKAIEKREKDIKFINDVNKNTINLISYISPSPAPRPSSSSSSNRINRSFRPTSASKANQIASNSNKIIEATNILIEEDNVDAQNENNDILTIDLNPQVKQSHPPKPKGYSQPSSVTLNDVTMKAYVNKIVRDLGEQSLEENSTRKLVHEDLSKVASNSQMIEPSNSIPQLSTIQDGDDTTISTPPNIQKPNEIKDNWSPSPRISRIKEKEKEKELANQKEIPYSPEITTKTNLLLLSHKIAMELDHRNISVNNYNKRNLKTDTIKDEENNIEISYSLDNKYIKNSQSLAKKDEGISPRIINSTKDNNNNKTSSIKVVLPITIYPYNNYLKDNNKDKNNFNLDNDKHDESFEEQQPVVINNNNNSELKLASSPISYQEFNTNSSLETNSSIILPQDLSHNIQNSLNKYNNIVSKNKYDENLDSYLKNLNINNNDTTLSDSISSNSSPVNMPTLNWKSFLPTPEENNNVNSNTSYCINNRENTNKKLPVKVREEVIKGGLVEEDDEEIIKKNKKIIEIIDENDDNYQNNDENEYGLKNIQSLSIFKKHPNYYPLPGDRNLEEKIIRDTVLNRLKSQAKERTQATAKSLNVSPPSLSPRISHNEKKEIEKEKIQIDLRGPPPLSPSSTISPNSPSYIKSFNEHQHGTRQEDLVYVNNNESSRLPSQMFNTIAPCNKLVKEINTYNYPYDNNIKDTPWLNSNYNSSPPSSPSSSPIIAPIHTKATLMQRNTSIKKTETISN